MPRSAVDLDRGEDGNDALGCDLGGPEPVGHVRHELHADPQAGEARQRDRVHAEVEDLLGVAGEQHRHLRVGERGLAGGRDRRRLRDRVVAGEHEHAAVGRDAHEVAVLEDVAAAVDAGRLAVPDADDAVAAVELAEPALLAAPDRGRRQLLVHAGHEVDVVVGHELGLAGDGQVEAAERRTLVAGDEGAGPQAGPGVGPVAVEGHPDQRLDAGQQHRPALDRVLVAEVEGVGPRRTDVGNHTYLPVGRQGRYAPR